MSRAEKLENSTIQRKYKRIGQDSRHSQGVSQVTGKDEFPWHHQIVNSVKATG